MWPVAWTARGDGASLFKDRCVRVMLYKSTIDTHITESREVLYPWHPWYGRSVWIYQTLTKNGAAICHCGLSQTRDSRALEVPQWMFDSAACQPDTDSTFRSGEWRRFTGAKGAIVTRPPG